MIKLSLHDCFILLSLVYSAVLEECWTADVMLILFHVERPNLTWLPALGRETFLWKSTTDPTQLDGPDEVALQLSSSSS